MDAGTKFSVKLTDGKTLTYRIIGINHDELADGSGKAGLTFFTTSTNISSRMNPDGKTIGGWEKSELRGKMNSGEIWNLMPSDFQSKVKSVRKLTNNVDSGIENKDAAVTATTDKLFLLSYSEIVDNPEVTENGAKWPPNSWLSKEGTQYEVFRTPENKSQLGNSLSNGDAFWERSLRPTYYNPTDFLMSFQEVGHQMLKTQNIQRLSVPPGVSSLSSSLSSEKPARSELRPKSWTP